MHQTVSMNNLTSRDIYDVTRLNREARAVLEGGFPQIWIQGEVSNFTQPGSGHMYFSLKDAYSQVRCAMFRHKNQNLKFAPENGLAVLARANVSLYETRGEFQLIIVHMEPAGDGLLQQAFEQLKKKLFTEGLFDEAHKKPIPDIPRTIGVITSPSGAAIRDIISILARRYPLAEVIIYPSAVQGDEAVNRLIQMLQMADSRDECDVLILARGGGSMEDLWAFNNEQLAHSIYQLSIPVVTGIGHEIDFTIADFVADYRAATPSAAAELISPDQNKLKISFSELEKRLQRLLNDMLKQYAQTILELRRRIIHPQRQLQMLEQHLDSLILRLQHVMQNRLNDQLNYLDKLTGRLHKKNPLYTLSLSRQQLANLEQKLNHTMQTRMTLLKEKLLRLANACESISPYATLKRGYAIVTRSENNEIVLDSQQLEIHENVRMIFARGSALSTVRKINKTRN